MPYDPLKLEDTLNFGKHEGSQIEDLIEDKPEYVAWLVENDVVVFDQEVITKLEDKKII